MAGKNSGGKDDKGKKSRTRQGKNKPGEVTQLYPEIEEAIRRRAYELYEERGRQEGFHEQDWIRAEEEVRLRYEREKSA